MRGKKINVEAYCNIVRDGIKETTARNDRKERIL